MCPSAHTGAEGVPMLVPLPQSAALRETAAASSLSEGACSGLCAVAVAQRTELCVGRCSSPSGGGCRLRQVRERITPSTGQTQAAGFSLITRCAGVFASLLFCLQNLPPAAFASAKVPAGGSTGAPADLRACPTRGRVIPAPTQRTALPPSLREVPQCAHWGGGSTPIPRRDDHWSSAFGPLA